MDTYELKEAFSNTQEFVYQYPESFTIKDTLFKHIGYGLYRHPGNSGMGKQVYRKERASTLPLLL